LILSRGSFNGLNNTSFYYIKKDSLQGSFAFFSSCRIILLINLKFLVISFGMPALKDSSFMPLSVLPGISAAADSINQVSSPLHSISVNAKCEGSGVVITWKTAQEPNIRYNVERSADGIHWTAIGNKPATGNSIRETSYFFTDNKPVQNAYYRIAEYDLDDNVQYSSVIRSSFPATDVLSCGQTRYVKTYLSILLAKVNHRL
jgi:hypothetical protein